MCSVNSPQVFQGERGVARHNAMLGTFILDKLPPAPRHVPQIDIEFYIDTNGVLRVQAMDVSTGGPLAWLRVLGSRLFRHDVVLVVRLLALAYAVSGWAYPACRSFSVTSGRHTWAVGRR